LELKIKEYIDLRKKQEILGGLVGKIMGGYQNEIVFDILHFLPFPNLADDSHNFAKPPEIWFKILEEWRIFYFSKLQFIGFLHTHPISSSRISDQDQQLAQLLRKKYGTIIFIILSENRSLRCYLFNEDKYRLIDGASKYYKILLR